MTDHFPVHAAGRTPDEVRAGEVFAPPPDAPDPVLGYDGHRFIRGVLVGIVLAAPVWAGLTRCLTPSP